MQACREFDFSENEFELLQGLVYSHTGITLSAHKQDLVYGRLSRRLRALGMTSFRDYCDLIESGQTEELEQFTNAITTNLTSFFREVHHFDFIGQKLIPALMQKNAGSRRLRIWSAGCSTGEEPYSIAITLRETIPDIDRWDIRILATDLDTDVVARAKQGIYPKERIDGLDKQRVNNWFRHGTGNNCKSVRVNPDVQKMITFKPLNLMHEWPMKGPFDVIFCRNVVIYFDKPTQQTLFDRYADILKPDCHLFIGHSESLHNVTKRFRLIGKTIYQRTG